MRVAVCLLGAFAAYYTYFLGSIFYELYGPTVRFCATPQVWALQGAAILFAPPALIGSAALWFIGRRKDVIGIGFSRASKIVLVILGLCAATNLLILMPHLDKPILFLATANAKQSRAFYEGILGLTFVADEWPALVFQVGESMLRIQKVELVHADQYTALGWAVSDIRQTVSHLRATGITFERYEGMDQDGDGIWHTPSGAFVAWFKDPDGHTLSLTQFK